MIYNVIDFRPRVHKFYGIKYYLYGQCVPEFWKIHDMNLKLRWPLSNCRNGLNFKTASKWGIMKNYTDFHNNLEPFILIMLDIQLKN